MTIPQLKPYEDREAFISLADGEHLHVNVVFVDAEYEDIIVDILDTDQPERYSDRKSAYTIPASLITEVKAV